AEDGIRDKLVTGVQTCVFRSVNRRDDALLWVNTRRPKSDYGVGEIAFFPVHRIPPRNFWSNCPGTFIRADISKGTPSWRFVNSRSEERRVGTECSTRWSVYDL